MKKGGLVLMLAVLMGMLALPVSAVGEVGSIRVTAEPGMAGSSLTLSYVGNVWAGGLQLTEEFGGGYVTETDIKTRELIQWLSGQVRDGLEKEISQDGTVMFTGLPEGIYLLTQKIPAPGYYATQPMLIRLPEEDGSWMAQAYPKVEKFPYDTPQTGQSMTPILAAMGMVVSAFGIGIWYEKWHKSRKK